MTETVIRFLQEHNALPKVGSAILIAVSGGADSMCLLYLLQEIAPRFHWHIAAAHFNHGLRGEEADRDEHFVEDYCRIRSIPCLCEKGDVAAVAFQKHLGLEEAARLLRYQFLDRACKALNCSLIATAHNADDNAETILMHLIRGSGTAGLQGIPLQRDSLLRPLLCLTREEILAFNQAKGIPWIEDSSNADDFCTRNRIRHHILPLIKEENPRFSQACRRLADLSRADEAALRVEAEQFCAPYLTDKRLPCSPLLALPPAISSRALRLMAGQELSSDQVQSLFKLCRADGSAAMVQLPGLTVRAEYGWLNFNSSFNSPLKERTLPAKGSLLLPEAGLCLTITEGIANSNIHKSFTKYLFKSTEVYGKISVRHRLPGDRYSPRGRGCSKSLKSLMNEARIPEATRDSLPVFTDAKGILAVYPFGPAQRGKPEPGDLVLQIQFQEMTPHA